MLATLLFVACDGGSASGAAASPGGDPAVTVPPPDAAIQAARGAPLAATPWDGPWRVRVVAPEAPGPRALAAALGVPLTAPGPGRPTTAPGELAVIWLEPDVDPARAAASLRPAPGPQGEVVAVLAPGPAEGRARALATLPWSSVGVIDPTISLDRLGADAPDAPLAGRVAARELAEHYGLAYVASPGAYAPGLDAWLGPFTLDLLRADDPRTRAEGARAAGGAGRADALAPLAADPSVAVRLAVAAGAAGAPLLELAADGDPTVRARAADRIDAVDVLADLLRDPSSVVRVVAAHRLGALAATGTPEVRDALARAAASPDAYVRWKAAWGLGRGRAGREVLERLLGDEDVDVRREAARALGRLGDARAVPALARALEDENSFVRRWAAAALGDLRAAEAVPALRRAAGEPTLLVAAAAAGALLAIGEPATPPIYRPPRRPSTPDELDALLASPDATVRKDTAKFLAGSDDAAPMERLAADPDGEVRKSAVEAMGWGPRTAAFAAAHVGDRDPDVRVTAMDALRRGGAGTVAVLAPWLGATDAEQRLRAVEALAASRDPAAATALAPLAADPDERVRAAVVGRAPALLGAQEPSALVRRAAGAPDADRTVSASPGTAMGRWVDGVWSREDELLHVRFSWNDDADRPAAHRSPRPPIVRAYGHPDRG